MPIYASEPESNYTPPPEGLFPAVCVDVIDKGVQQTQWGDKHKVLIRWQLDEEGETGDRYLVSKSYTLSLAEKANLRKDLESWRSKKFTPAELRGFDLERLIGVPCQVQVVHNVKDDGKVYANVNAVVPMPRNAPPVEARDYQRQAMKNAPVEEHYDDDSMPF